MRPWQTLLVDGRGGIGYQLKDRVMDADQCLDALSRVARGAMALDQTVIAKLLGRRPRADPMAKLTERERSVLALMAEGLSNAAIAGRLFLSEGAISKYTTNIFAKLGIFVDDDTNRRLPRRAHLPRLRTAVAARPLVLRRQHGTPSGRAVLSSTSSHGLKNQRFEAPGPGTGRYSERQPLARRPTAHIHISTALVTSEQMSKHSCSPCLIWILGLDGGWA